MKLKKTVSDYWQKHDQCVEDRSNVLTVSHSYTHCCWKKCVKYIALVLALTKQWTRQKNSLTNDCEIVASYLWVWLGKNIILAEAPEAIWKWRGTSSPARSAGKFFTVPPTFQYCPPSLRGHSVHQGGHTEKPAPCWHLRKTEDALVLKTHWPFLALLN